VFLRTKHGVRELSATAKWNREGGKKIEIYWILKALLVYKSEILLIRGQDHNFCECSVFREAVH